MPAFGPGLTLLLLILTPIVWSFPVALAMSEMAAAMPDEGGYVTWVTRAFGRFWGFQVGWWSWINSFVDVAVYPALFVAYARYWRPEMAGLERWLWALAFIVVLTALNLVGVRPVGRAAVILGAAGPDPDRPARRRWRRNGSTQAPWRPFAVDDQSLLGGLGLGLAVMMWNYSGWDAPSTTLGETRSPERAYRLALFIALPVITLAYVLPVAVALGSGVMAWTAWDTGTLPTVAAKIGGAWLGHAVAAGAMLSTGGLFLSLLLTNSRLPYVMARDGMLGAWLGRLHPRFGTPWAAVLLSAAFYAAFAVFSFKELIVLNIWLYSLTLIVELAAFVRLRVAASDEPHSGGCRAGRSACWRRRCRRRRARCWPWPRPGGATRWPGWRLR